MTKWSGSPRTKVSFSRIDVVKDIYGQSPTYVKAPTYDTFSSQLLGMSMMRNKGQQRPAQNAR